MNSHAVRSMEHCIICAGVGFYRVSDCSANFLLVKMPLESHHGPFQKYAHPRCIIRYRGLAKLLELPTEELGHIRICDVSKRAMGFILKRKASGA
jgi:hypothetical protein